MTFRLPPPHAAQRHGLQRGMTLIELMTTIAVLGVLMAIAAPSFNPMMERYRVRQAAEELQATLYYARSEAIKRSGNVALAADSNWSNGWKVTAGSDELQVTDAPSKITITQSNSKNTLFFDRWGMISETAGGTPAAMDFLVQANGSTTSMARLCVQPGGRLVLDKSGNACS